MMGGSAMTGGRGGFPLVLRRRRGLRHDRIVLERSQRAAIDIVKIPPDLQLAVIVDKSGLIGEVQPDRPRLEHELLLWAAVRAFDLLRRPVLVRAPEIEKKLGIFGSMLDPHAAVAFGTHGMAE